MKRFVFIFLILCGSFSSFATENSQKTGFYIQVSPLLGFGFRTGKSRAPEIALEGGLGYDVDNHFSLEVDGVAILFWKPYDATSIELLGRGVYYPWGHIRFAPFLSIAAGGGSLEDKNANTKDGQLIVGGDVGATWFVANRHGIVFRITDLYHKTDYVKGNYNLVHFSILYRYAF